MELKPITAADEEIMLSLLTHAEIGKTYMLPLFARREDALPLARRFYGLSEDKSRFVRGIYAGGTLVGFLNDVEMEGGTVELGYVIHPRHWGKGYATLALKEAIRQLFSLGWQEVVCGAFEENPASIRVMEKAGMARLEKTDEIEYRGTLHRCIYYGIQK